MIRYDKLDRVGTITIDRPSKRNAMTYGMQRELREFLSRAGSDTDIRALVLTGVPGSFCAGTDLAELRSTPVDDRAPHAAGDAVAQWWPIVACPKPIIAAIDGPAVGMGAEYTSQCDIRIATTRARFAWNFVHRGLVADTGAGTWLLPRLIGMQAAERLLYSGAFISAEEALEIGYVSQVVDPEDLSDAVQEEASRLSQGAPLATFSTKHLILEGMSRTAEEHLRAHAVIMDTCLRSKDHQEGVAAFLEGREPEFTGT